MNLGEVITALQRSGVDLTRETNVGEIKFKGGDYIAVEFLDLKRLGVTQEDIDDAVDQIESAISDLESAKRSLR